MSGNSNDNNLYNRNLTVQQRAGYKAWETRRRNARRADYRARGLKAWATRRARQNYGTEDQGTLTTRVLSQYS